MKLVESFEYNGRKVDVYQDDKPPISFGNRMYKVNVDGECISNDHPMPGQTPELLQEDIKNWIDNNSTGLK